MEEREDYSAMAYPNSENILPSHLTTTATVHASSAHGQISQLQQNEAFRYGFLRPPAVTINTQPRTLSTYPQYQNQQQSYVGDDPLLRSSLQYATVSSDLTSTGGNTAYSTQASDRLPMAQQLHLPLQVGYGSSYAVRIPNESIAGTEASLITNSEPVLATINGQQRTTYESWPWAQRAEIDARSGLTTVQPTYDCSLITPKQESGGFTTAEDYSIGRQIQPSLHAWSPFATATGPHTLFMDTLKMRSQQLPAMFTESPTSAGLSNPVHLGKATDMRGGTVGSVLHHDPNGSGVSSFVEANKQAGVSNKRQKVITPPTSKDSKALPNDLHENSLSQLIQLKFNESQGKERVAPNLPTHNDFLLMDEICTRLKELLESDESFQNVTELAKILNAHRKRVYAAVGTLEHCNILTKERLDGKQSFVYHGKSNVIDEQSVVKELSRLESTVEGVMSSKYQTLFVLKEIKEKPQSVREIYDKLRSKYEDSSHTSKFEDKSPSSNSANKTVRRRLYDITKVLDVFEVFTKQDVPKKRAATFEWSLGRENDDSSHNLSSP